MFSVASITSAAPLTSRFIKKAFEQSNSGSTSKMHLIFDFDNTITTADTVNQLGLAGAAFQASRDAVPPVVLSSSAHSQSNGHDSNSAQVPTPVYITPTVSSSTTQNFTSIWTDIVKAYGSDYTNYSNSFLPHEDERIRLEDEIAYQHGLRGVDLASVRRVENARLFAGMTPSDLQGAGRKAVDDRPGQTRGTEDGQKVGVRRGFGELVLAAKERGDRVSILSANWSRSWIHGVLGGENDCLEVVAQEIDGDGSIVPWKPEDTLAKTLVVNEKHRGNQGEEGLRIATSGDKLVAMKMITQPEDTIAYFGDSTTDLECLLYAAEGPGGGVGVILAEDAGSKLLRTLRRLRRAVPHVSDFQDDQRLFWARDFDEMLRTGPFAVR